MRPVFSGHRRRTRGAVRVSVNSCEADFVARWRHLCSVETAGYNNEYTLAKIRSWGTFGGTIRGEHHI